MISRIDKAITYLSTSYISAVFQVLFMPVRPDMLNGVGWLQGGLYSALCDEAMALALFTVLEEEEDIATISESTSFLQGIKKGCISAQAKVVKKGGLR